MKLWEHSPLVRLLFPFLAGIAVAVNWPSQQACILIIAAVLISAISMLVFIPRLNVSYRKSWWFGILVNASFFILAYQLTVFKTEYFKPNHFLNHVNGTPYVYARIKGTGKEKEKTIQAVAEILAVQQHTGIVETCGKAMLYFIKDSNALRLKYGDEVVLRTKFTVIPLPPTPVDFNYREFLCNKQIYKQAFVKPCNWVYTGKNTGNFLLRNAIDIRDNLLAVFTASHFTGDELAVSAALLLGYTHKLGADLISAYANTGTLHVLSVSGLHVGIIFLALNSLLFFTGRIKHGAVIKALVLLFFLWFYALITGLSPAVLRAVTMFSFIVTARAFNRNTNVYNTLAASAMFLLMFNPYLIMDVGFQLSYLAVTGIVAIQPLIYSWFNTGNRVLDNLWAITAVSIAAQLATFPLILYYFHRFPVYFLLANALVIPLSALVLYAGIVLFIVSGVPVLLKYFVMLFIPMVRLLNECVKRAEQLPYALIENIYITRLETVILYGAVIFFFYYFSKKRYSHLVAALGCVLLLLSVFSIKKYRQNHQKKIIIYNLLKTSPVDFISSRKNILYADTAVLDAKKHLLPKLGQYWQRLGITNNNIVHTDTANDYLYIRNNFIQFYDKHILLIKNSFQAGILKNAGPLKIDYLVISNNSYISMDVLKTLYQPQLIVFDASNSQYLVNKWKQRCSNIKQPFYSVIDSGTLVINL